MGGSTFPLLFLFAFISAAIGYAIGSSVAKTKSGAVILAMTISFLGTILSSFLIMFIPLLMVCGINQWCAQNGPGYTLWFGGGMLTLIGFGLAVVLAPITAFVTYLRVGNTLPD